jgi:hypothetical protein
MSIATVNRALNGLRGSNAVDFQKGMLFARNWKSLEEASQFDPGYLHLRKPPQ